MANTFDNPAFQFLQRPSMDDFLKRCQQRFNRFGLSDSDFNDAIKSACDFFNIPMPRMIQDLTNAQNGQTVIRQTFLDNLPPEFDRKTYSSIAEQMGLNPKSIDRTVRKWCDDGKLENVAHGQYRKK